MSAGKCEHCGDSSATHFTRHAGRLCDDVEECCRRFAEQFLADLWYAEEVRRMAERAPA